MNLSLDQFNFFIHNFNLIGNSVENYCKLYNYNFVLEEHRDVILLPHLGMEVFIAKNYVGNSINKHEINTFSTLSCFVFCYSLDCKFLAKPLVSRLETIKTIDEYYQLSKLGALITPKFIIENLELHDFGIYNKKIMLMNTQGLIPYNSSDQSSLLKCDHCFSLIKQNINYILDKGNLGYCPSCGKELPQHNTSVLYNKRLKEEHY